MTSLDLYTWKTSNGRKATIMLEECGLDYNVHPIDISADVQLVNGPRDTSGQQGRSPAVRWAAHQL